MGGLRGKVRLSVAFLPGPANSEVDMRSVLILAAVAAIACSQRSAADPYSELSAKDTRRVAYDYAQCVVGRHFASASAALLSDTDNSTMMKGHDDLIDGQCLVRTVHGGAQMKFPGDLYRYALADALVAREFAAAPAIDPSNTPPLQRRSAWATPAPLPANASKRERAKYQDALKDFEEAQSFRVFGLFGECVVRNNPAAAKALLSTRVESAGEDAAFQALHTALGECLPEGKTLAFGKLVLRGTIAVNYYRLGRAAELGSAVSRK
jgi:hypothetical protein